MNQNDADKLVDWVKSYKHLPSFLRDFHDQKDVFKTIGGAKSADPTKDISWIDGHCYTIDHFLWWMAIHGYTLQKSRAKLPFMSVHESIQSRRDKETELLKAIMKPKELTFPLENGICLTCEDKEECPMTDMLPLWREVLSVHGDNVKEERPDLWDEYSVDEPTVEDGIITWCPMHHEKRMVKRAAYIRSDGVLATGKSHAEIISKSPPGTCKDGSISGFIDNTDTFISREEAFRIAFEAGQLVPEKIVKNGKYLLSEEIWSDRENGEWTYDEKKGYVRR